MGKWLALAGVALTFGCNYGAGAFRCTNDNQCGAGGTCELDNLCSSPSSTCPSGRVYSDLSGVLSGQCVGGIPPGTDGGGEVPIDASIDAPPVIPPDATACFGTGIVRVCLVEPPTQPLTISDATIIDTSDNAVCAALLPGSTGGDYCVVAATTIAINNDLRATGSRPLVLLAIDSITSTGGNIIDVGSHRDGDPNTPETGAGADPASCNATTAPSNGGGGAGGTFAGAGGRGGNGNGSGAGGGAPGLAVNPITELRGGCPGQTGASAVAANAGTGGHGGGAVYLIAGTKIEIAGGINAAGEGGVGGIRNTSGGGGGGAGGMIGFDAPLITVTSLLLANGGGGAEGSGQNNASGDVGDDSTALGAAAGGAGSANTGGDGGAGSAGAAAGPGSPGASAAGGGGGGGGGAGLIKAPATATLGGQVSPLSTP